MARRGTPEQDLQIAVKEYLDACCPPPPRGPWWSAVNPIPAKTRAAAGLSKAMGMKAGVPDLIFVWRGRAIWIELKAKKGAASFAQKLVHQDLTVAGCVVATCRSVEAVEGVLRTLQVPLLGSVMV